MVLKIQDPKCQVEYPSNCVQDTLVAAMRDNEKVKYNR